MFHRSERLLLRPLWQEDWSAIHRAIADEAVVRNLARAPWPYEPCHARAFVAQPVNPMFPRLAMTRACDSALIGCIGIDPHEGAVELGYWVARDHWGRGYATEAGRAMVEIARMLGHLRLEASHFLDNPASGRVLHKVGFVPTGVVRERASLARGASAPTAEFALDLVEDRTPLQRAA